MQIPQLNIYVANAFNAVQGNFLSKPLFKLTNNSGQTVTWDGKEAAIPDQISASTASHFYRQSNSMLMASKSDYDRQYSIAVEAEYTGVSFSGSVSSKYLYHGNLFTQTESSYALNFMLREVFNFERLEFTVADLTDEFIAAVEKLPQELVTKEEQAAYFQLFKNYGTHYLSMGTMGGQVVMETRVDTSLVQNTSVHDVSGAISAGYDGFVASGKFSIEAAYKSSAFLEEHKEQTTITLDALGGDFVPGGDLKEWSNSIYDTPSILLNCPTMPTTKISTLECIAEAVKIAGASQDVINNIYTALQKYVTEKAYEDGLLGTPVPFKPYVVSQQSAGDAFVIGYLDRGEDDGARTFIEGLNSPSQSCNELYAQASQHYWPNGNTKVPYASLTMPVKLETYYNVINEDTSSLPAKLSLHKIAMGDPNHAGLGEWEEQVLSSKTSDKNVETAKFVAKQDGFVVAYINWNEINGSRGYIDLEVNNATVAAASQHRYSDANTYIPNNSFCAPVREGDNITITFTKTSQNPLAKAFFVQLNAQFAKIGEPENRTPESTFKAETDGFLLAYLHSDTVDLEKNEEAKIILKAIADGEDLLGSKPLAGTSIHNHHKNADVHVPKNSVLLPVPKGFRYMAEYNSVEGSPVCELRWYPLTKPSE
ncbi:MAC/perforin domain-containing protein [Photobacterium angustum]|uniref:MACPF domain-containing protein n=1 Tax=Photobacterium angustum TaxID=661 RepID=A0A2S7VI10_PHOAN|nr:MAC/perforin domain-containing protein [Photobacterium angustum]PQJ61718.1 hypothetical protein BTO08_15620 [Photobacterium angustum]